MLVSFATVQVTVLRPVEVKEWGQLVVDWSEPERVTVEGCVDYGLTATDAVQGVEVSAGVRELIMPAGTDIRATDRVEHLGAVWEIVGLPVEQRSPTGVLSHVLVTLKRWEGKK